MVVWSEFTGIHNTRVRGVFHTTARRQWLCSAEFAGRFTKHGVEGVFRRVARVKSFWSPAAMLGGAEFTGNYKTPWARRLPQRRLVAIGA
jgi:hypothetical protein